MKTGQRSKGKCSVDYKTLAPILLLGIMIFSAYSNTFSSPPVLDDFHTFIEDPLVRIQDWSISSVVSLSQTKFSWARLIPMTTLSFDLWAGKGELFNFHLTNLIIHLLAFLSVIFLVHQIWEASQLNSSEMPNLPVGPVSIFVAGLWALHPLQTNAVTYIVQRMASISALFTILAVAFYIFARLMSVRGKDSKGRVFLIYSVGVLSLAMGLLSKENAAMIPVLVVLTEAWFFQPDLFQGILSSLKKRWLLAAFGGFLCLSSIAYYVYSSVIPGYSGRHFTLIERLLTESRVVFWYVSIFLWPDPRRLSLEHDVVVSVNLLTPPTTILAILSLALIGWWVVSQRRRYPIITYGLLWFALNLVIESSIIPLELVFEHRMYLPSVGLVLSITVAIMTFCIPSVSLDSRRDLLKLSWCCFFIICSMLTLLTFQRNCDWQDMETLARDNVSKAPNHPRSHSNLSTAYLRRGKFQEAIEEAKIAISLGNEHFEQHFVAGSNMLAAYSSLGEHHKVLEEGERLLTEKPPGRVDVGGLPAFYLNIARSQQLLGELKGAYLSVIRALWSLQNTPGRSTDLKQIALTAMILLVNEAREKGEDLDGDGKSDPGESSALFWTARQLMNLRDQMTARDLLVRAVAENPEDKESVELLASIDRENNLNGIQAIKKDFNQKYVRRPYSPFNLCMAGAYLIQKHNTSNKLLVSVGESLLNMALWLNPDSPDAHLLKGWFHFSKDEVADAIREAKITLDLDPEYARAWLGLAFFSAKAGHAENALSAFEKTLALHPGYPERNKILEMISALRQASLELAEARQ